MAMESVNLSESEIGPPSTNLPHSKCSSGSVITAIFCIISIMTNLRVCHISIFPPRGKPRSVALLVAHLSCLAIGITVWHLFTLLDLCWVGIPVWNGVCELSSLFRNTVFGIFPWNVAFIIATSNEASQNTNGTTKRIGLLWLFSGLLNMPTVFMITLLGDFTLTVSFELLRFLAYHVVVVLYLMYEVFKIRSKLRYLHFRSIPSDRMARQVQRVRGVCVHCVMFTLFWLPFGVVLFLYKILRRRSANSLSSWANVMIPANMIFFMTVPAIYIFLNENITLLHFCVGRRLHMILGRWRSPCPLLERNEEAPVFRETDTPQPQPVFPRSSRDEQLELDEVQPTKEKLRGKCNAGDVGTSGMSRISTVGKSVSLASSPRHFIPDTQLLRVPSVMASSSSSSAAAAVVHMSPDEHEILYSETLV